MDRRRFCAAVAGGVAGGLSGCGASGLPFSDSATADGTAASVDPVPLARLGSPSDICEAEVVEDFAIEAIVDPAFARDWAGHDVDPRYTRDDAGGTLPDDAVVVGREHDGRARAYPLAVLWHHEVVNDTLGVPVAVTYCSICRSGLVADRRVGGEATTFGVTGQLWRPPDRYISASAEAGRAFGAGRWNASRPVRVRDGANLVMYDRRTRSFWSQAIGQAICGPLRGTRLDVVPFALASWADWRGDHPDTTVLLPPPHSGVDG